MKPFTWLVLLGLLLASCGQKQEAASENMELLETAPPPQAETDAANAGLTEDKSLQDGTKPTEITAAPAATRKLVYHAEVRVKVADLDRANAYMDSLTRRHGAYVAEASEARQDGEWQHQVKIRVLPSHFQAMLGGLRGLGALKSKTISTDDVTAEHADVAARLGTKRALEQRYVALLGQAKKVSDILEIEEQIGEVRSAIESTESRLKTLNDQVAYSTITLTYFQELVLDKPDAPVLSFGSRLTQSFYDGWELLTGLVLVLVTAWPLLLGGVVGAWGVRAWRQRRRQRTAGPAPE